jgi:hypothetical protein
VLGAGEDDRAVDGIGGALGQPCAQRQRQQRLLFGLRHEDRLLLHAFGGGGLQGNLHLHGIVDELLAQFLDRLRHGGGKEQALALRRQQAPHALQRHDEAQIHHLVGLIQHEDLHIAQRQRALVDQIEQAAGVATSTSQPGTSARACLPAGMPPKMHWIERLRTWHSRACFRRSAPPVRAWG